MDPVKAAKIKKRTLVGGGLSLALVGLLWLAHVDTQHVFVPVVGLAMALGGAFELARMDRLGGKDLRVPLFAALFATTVVHFVNNLGDAFSSGHDRLGYEGWWGCWLAVLVFTAIVLPVRRLPRGPGGVVRWAAAIALVVGLFSAFMELGETERVRGAAYAVAALCLVVDAALSPARKQGAAAVLRDVAVPLGLALWAVPALPALDYVDRWLGVAGLGALLLLSKVGDVFGYYVGSAIGKSHPFPRLSPGKTTAGCVGSLVAGCAFGAACVWWGLLPDGRLGVLGGVIAGGVVNVASQAGDLFESKVKRTAEVKDSGALFGPSGGFLDLTDSLLFSVPVALLTWPLLFAAD